MGHLRENGFDVTVVEVGNIVAHQDRADIPHGVRGCHSAEASSYQVEGHVPADVLKRFLAERADVAGIAVPGMPIGPPGMEGSQPRPYDVVTFDAEGHTTVYAKR